MAEGQAPWAPPLVAMTGGIVGHLLAWEQHELDGSWWAWVSWVQESGGRHLHKVVQVRAGSLRPLEPPEAYKCAGLPAHQPGGASMSGLLPYVPVPSRATLRAVR
jgi:hypothetical protein